MAKMASKINESVERDGSGFAERQVEIPCVDGVQRLLRGAGSSGCVPMGRQSVAARAY